jgi:hypothetical protein
MAVSVVKVDSQRSFMLPSRACGVWLQRVTLARPQQLACSIHDRKTDAFICAASLLADQEHAMH